MTLEWILLWFSFMVPLLASPGPANIMISSLAGTFGFRKTLGFIAGLTFWNTVSCFLVGLFFGLIHAKFDGLFHVIEILGSFYILYLAYTFYVNSKKISDFSLDSLKPKEPSFSSGLLMQTLNGKLYPVLSLMFSQFLDSHTQPIKELLVLCFLFPSLCLGIYFFWAAVGAHLHRSLNLAQKKLQMKISAAVLGLTGVWLLYGSLF